MKTIKLTEETYKELLHLKNYLTVQHGEVTNPNVNMEEGDKDIDEMISQMDKMDFQPEMTFDDCISTMIWLLWEEQSTGEGNRVDNWPEDESDTKDNKEEKVSG